MKCDVFLYFLHLCIFSSNFLLVRSELFVKHFNTFLIESELEISHLETIFLFCFFLLSFGTDFSWYFFLIFVRRNFAISRFFCLHTPPFFWVTFSFSSNSIYWSEMFWTFWWSFALLQLSSMLLKFVFLFLLELCSFTLHSLLTSFALFSVSPFLWELYSFTLHSLWTARDLFWPFFGCFT